MNGDRIVVGLGDALRDSPEPTVNEQEASLVEAAHLKSAHKCLSCSHEMICAVAGAIRNMMNAFDEVVISQCGAYDSTEPVITAEDLESDDGRSE